MLLLAFSGDAVQLVPDGTLLLHLAVIAVMVALLNATLLKPISRILENRERRTKGRLDEAQIITAEGSKKFLEYESSLRRARAEGYQLLEEERTAAARERDLRVGKLKAEVTASLQEQKEKLRLDAEQIKANLAKDARAMASQIVRQILRREVN